ncbi:hypothetical protein MM236_10100 [Belliella sp. DSM 107340]|uniref:Uncharacterized protein n=1 Tax=Belliella calami TaxID=2923436 RepID=A0ABS9UNZ9_9BACT|nr:hypothetical protein [Belliella calami]MCH7398343.1 hypothetical protein [Belliella calami]
MATFSSNSSNLIRFKKESLTISVLLIFVLITSGYPLSSVPGNFCYHLLILPVLILTLKRRNHFFKKNYSTIFYLFFLSVTVFSFLINFNIGNLSTNLKFILVLTFSYVFTNRFSFDQFSVFFIKMMKIISVISLIGYIILNLTNLQLPLSTFKNINDVEYYNGIIYFAIKSFSVWGNDGFKRNIGAFWEPGIFATYLLVAITLELWKTGKSTKLNLALFLITLLTTKSTFAYLMIFPIFISFLTINSVVSKKQYLLYLLILSLIILVYMNLNLILYFLNQLNPTIFGKLVSESVSFNERIDSPLTNILIFKNNFLFGAGLGNTENLFVLLTHGSQTSTSTYFLAAFGVSGVFYTISFVIGILSFDKVNIISRITFLTIVLSQINKEPHIYFTATFIILFYFLKNIKLSNVYGSK